MKLLRRSLSSADAVGTARVGRRTKDLIKRLHAGDVAVIDHEDLDRVAAEGLIEARVGAVINASASISGRYPNEGPLLIAAAGIPLLDGVGSQVLDTLADGKVVELEGVELRAGGQVVAVGVRQTLGTLEQAYELAKTSIGAELERFAENTLEYLRREHRLVVDPLEVPPLRTVMRGRHVLVVVRGIDYREDLAHLRAYVDEMRPVLIAVDGGADALMEMGWTPDVILGDFDSVSESTLGCGADLIVHGYADGRAPGAARLEEAGRAHHVMCVGGTSEDVALLLAYELGAQLIVAVGTHASMVEFLDKGRAGMASTFLVRLKVGPILVDAKGVSRLWQQRAVRTRDIFVFLFAVMLSFVIVGLVVVPSVFFESLTVIVSDFWRSITR